MNFEGTPAPTRSWRRYAAAGAWLAVIAWCTLRSAPSEVDVVARDHWYCIACGDAGVADVILNLLLFLPLGLGLRALDWRLTRAAIVMCALTIAIETTQANFLVGRDGTLGDVLANTMGGIAGWWCYSLLRAMARPARQTARTGVTVLLVAMPLLWLATAGALRPLLTNAPWIGQRLHHWAGYRRFPGTLGYAAIDGVPITNEELARAADWRDSIAVHLTLIRDTGWTDDAVASLIRIVDRNEVEELSIDDAGDAARLEFRLRGSDWLLHSPKWLAANAMNTPAHQPWRLDGYLEPAQLVVMSGPVADPSRRHVRAFPLTLGLGWIFIHPFVDTVSDTALLWTALWLGFWFGLLGWFAAGLDLREQWLVGILSLTCFAGITGLTALHLSWVEVGVAAAAYLVLLATGRWRAGTSRAASSGSATTS